MSFLVTVLASVAAKVGAPIIKGVLQKHLGDSLAGTLAGQVVDQIAAKAGVPVEELETLPEEELELAVKETEANAPEIIELWRQGVEGQFQLLQQDSQHGFFNVFWRAGWMYLLAAFWLWRIVIVPILDARGFAIEGVDYAHLLTLTGWFMALYMGGHTLKEIGKNVTNAVSRRKGDVA